MLEVTVNINRKIIVAQLHAVRTHPRGKTLKKDTECTYNVVYDGVTVGIIRGKYGCGIDLAIKLLEDFKENGEIYKYIIFNEKITKIEKDNKNGRRV